MKVLLVNGSPNKEGCTYTALTEVAGALESAGVSTEIFQLGAEPIEGCRDCSYCRKMKTCVIEDKVNEFAALASGVDGLVFGSPVHFAAASGSITSFMDRLFFSCGMRIFAGKPGAVVVSCRRGGSTAALDQLNKYLSISQMPIVSSQYWNMIHGITPDEVLQDSEGVQIMRTLGKNMAWLLHCLQAGANAGIEPPEKERRIFTNFIR